MGLNQRRPASSGQAATSSTSKQQRSKRNALGAHPWMAGATLLVVAGCLCVGVTLSSAQIFSAVAPLPGDNVVSIWWTLDACTSAHDLAGSCARQVVLECGCGTAMCV